MKPSHFETVSCYLCGRKFCRQKQVKEQFDTVATLFNEYRNKTMQLQCITYWITAVHLFSPISIKIHKQQWLQLGTMQYARQYLPTHLLQSSMRRISLLSTCMYSLARPVTSAAVGSLVEGQEASAGPYRDDSARDAHAVQTRDSTTRALSLGSSFFFCKRNLITVDFFPIEN